MITLNDLLELAGELAEKYIERRGMTGHAE